MNTHLFRSPAALLPLVALVASGVLAMRGLLLAGDVDPAARDVRLATGWALLAALVLAAAYLLRKHMHRRGFSPEFRMRVPIEALERAQVRLAALRRDVARGAYTEPRALLAAARHVLAQEGVARVLRARVRPGEAGEPALVLSTEKTFPLLHSSRWMRGHLHLGLLFAILLLAHAGGAPRSLLGIAIVSVGLVVVVSGLVGIVQWARGPAALTRLERDLSIEEAFALDVHLARKLEGLLGQLPPALAEDVRAYRASPAERGRAAGWLAGLAEATDARAVLEDALVLAGQRARVGAELAVLSRARLGMHAWRIVHLPLVLLLVALVSLHLWAIWRY